MGQGGGDHAVWRLYGVSETLLTGGDAGFAYGLTWTLVLAAMIALTVTNSSVWQIKGNMARQLTIDN